MPKLPKMSKMPKVEERPSAWSYLNILLTPSRKDRKEKNKTYLLTWRLSGFA